jgi:hypothetical protein
MKLRADHLIALAALLVLGVLGGYVGWRQSETSTLPYAWTSTQPNGTRALALWLESMGYAVAPLEYQAFVPPADADVLFVLGPLTTFTDQEVNAVARWVERGGTLVAGLDMNGITAAEKLLAHFDVEQQILNDRVSVAAIDQPLLAYPPVGEISAPTVWGLTIDCPGMAVYARAYGVPVLASRAEGKGQVWLTTLVGAFTNEHIGESGNARLVLNILAASPGAHRIVFDEVHHGRALQQAQTLQGWLYGTPAGLAVLFAAAALFVYVLLGGRRFGRALPAPRAAARRAPEEYIVAMAKLFRRGGLRDATARHYHDRLKRVLAGKYRMDPSQSDTAFVAELARYRENLDQADLLRVLRALGQGGMGETDLVRLAHEAARWERRA